jgi:lysophospholipid acyltransferase (LPLAT)-like uncharacterized protein
VTAPAAGWQASGWRRAQAAAIPRLVAPVMKALARTWRLESLGMERFDEAVADGRAPIIACWHQVILPGTVFWRDRGIVILASQNFDGEWITRTLGHFGFAAARGSSSRGGARALIVLARQMRAGHGVAITVDGPRGPARHAQPGALWLARQTGHPILPFHIAASSAWHLGSWDRGLIPRPRSRVVMVVGEPFHVAPDADDDALERRRVELEAALQDVEAEAIGLAAVSEPTSKAQGPMPKAERP